jgi:hypothetical protein
MKTFEKNYIGKGKQIGQNGRNTPAIPGTGISSGKIPQNQESKTLPGWKNNPGHDSNG